MPFSEVFFHVVIGLETGEDALHQVTKKLVETKISEAISNLGGQAVAVKGMPDHAHILLAAPPVASADAFVTELKDATTELVAGMGRGESLEWKHGYGVVSVSRSHLDIVKEYVETQERRHATGKSNATLERFEP